MGSKALADAEDAGLRQSNLRRDGTIGQPHLTQSDNLPPTLFLCRRRQFTHVYVFHPGKLALRRQSSRLPKPDLYDVRTKAGPFVASAVQTWLRRMGEAMQPITSWIPE
jgi:hypothetical protein